MYNVTKKKVNTKNEEWIFNCATKIKEKWLAAEEEEIRKMYSGLGGLASADYPPDFGLLNNTNMRLQQYFCC